MDVFQYNVQDVLQTNAKFYMFMTVEPNVCLNDV